MGKFERSGGMMSPTPNEFSRVNFSDSPREEYGQVNPSDTYPNTPSELIPTPGDPERQFSSDKASAPDAMATETDDSQNAFAGLQQFLNNNLQIAGSGVCNDQNKPWTPRHGE
jgi:hypothetical protein